MFEIERPIMVAKVNDGHAGWSRGKDPWWMVAAVDDQDGKYRGDHGGW